MTERKPPGVPFESWVDKQIRDAQARGEFAHLAGAGRPMPEVTDTTYDELWWIKRKMAREGLSVLPPALALRKEAEDALAAAYAAPSELIVRRIITDVNAKIREMMFKPPPGPPLGKKPYDVDEVVREWRERRAAIDSGGTGDAGDAGRTRSAGGAEATGAADDAAHGSHA
ncbi:DnaJ family domain-containing protein [Streptomyces adustus]|uniref:DnaJ family domain-containing protein n=1 Tax=Streptomyces adustus TaxID=1609272 RepID=UPI003719F4EC